MKMNRSDLKNLIKECLVEILAEGLGSELQESVSFSKSDPKKPTRQLKKGKNPSNMTSALKSAILETSHGSDVMRDILADTAVATLPGFLGNDKSIPPVPGSAEDVVAQAQPEEMFSENVDRWANLAFETNSNPHSSFTPSPPPTTSRKLSNHELDAPVNMKKST